MDWATVMMMVVTRVDQKANVVEVVYRLGIITTTLYAYVNGDGPLKSEGKQVFAEAL